MPDPNEPAFPMLETDNPGHRFGMTVRCELAKAAMQGLCAGQFPGTHDEVARAAIMYADALIAALNATDGKGE